MTLELVPSNNPEGLVDSTHPEVGFTVFFRADSGEIEQVTLWDRAATERFVKQALSCQTAENSDEEFVVAIETATFVETNVISKQTADEFLAAAPGDPARQPDPQ